MRHPYKIVFFILVLILGSLNAFCQPAKKVWAKCYGGTDDDAAKSILQTFDGGYIIAGTSFSNDEDAVGHHGTIDFSDFLVIKINDTGGIGWTKSYGGTSMEYANSIISTKDGGYIIAGSTISNDGDVEGNHGPSFDAWILKIDANGNMLWQKCYGGSGNEEAFSILQSKDGGYVFAGYASSMDGDLTIGHTGFGGTLTQDLWVVKINDTGALEWQKDLGGSKVDVAWCIQQTESGNYMVAGYSESVDGDLPKHYGSAGGWDAWLLEFNDLGSLVWQKIYGGSGDDMFTSIKQTSDKGFILTGSTSSNDKDVSGNHLDKSGNPTTDAWVVKTDTAGNINWQKCYGGTGSETGVDICQTNDGGYGLAAYTSSFDGDITDSNIIGAGNDYWLVQLHPDDKIDWEETFGGTLSDAPNAVKQTGDGGYIIAGYTSSEDGDVTGWRGGAGDYWVLKLAKPLSVEDVKNNAGDIKIYPNPSQNSIIMQYHLSADATVTVTDVTGKAISSIPLSKNTTQTTINAATWLPGIYFYKVLQNGNTLQTGKLLKQ